MLTSYIRIIEIVLFSPKKGDSDTSGTQYSSDNLSCFLVSKVLSHPRFYIKHSFFLPFHTPFSPHSIHHLSTTIDPYLSFPFIGFSICVFVVYAHIGSALHRDKTLHIFMEPVYIPLIDRPHFPVQASRLSAHLSILVLTYVSV